MIAAMMSPMMPQVAYTGYMNPAAAFPALGQTDPSAMGMNFNASMEQMILGELVGILTSLMMPSTQNQFGWLDPSQSPGGACSANSAGGGGDLNMSSGTPNSGGDVNMGSGTPNSGGDVNMGSGTPNSGGAGAAQLAQSMVGKAAGTLSFKNYSHAGGVTNDCADFVSGVIADTEGFHKTGGDASVTTFQNDLEKQGWVKVSKSQCQPGDVAIIQGNAQHTELCTQAGGRQFTGANGSSTETVKNDNLNWATGVTYYHKPG